MRLSFALSAFARSSWPETKLPEVAMFGRSNAGKSSLINALAREQVARVSKEPGRTRTLNFYQGEGFLLVDLPGYGYAHMSHTDARRQATLLEDYLRERQQLAGVIQLVDIRHAPSVQDREWHARLKASGVPFLLLMGKADEVSRGQWRAREKEIVSVLESDATAAPWSARSREGVAVVEAFVQGVCTKGTA